MAAKKELKLFYKTGWQDPVLHYGFEGQPWGDAQFTHVIGEVDWWMASLPISARRMECVPRAQDKSGWDNPPDGVNYKLELPGEGDVVAVVRHGEVSIVDLSRPPWVLVADMDGTLIGEPNETVERLRRFWDLNCKFAIRPSDGVRLCQIVYNSGRNRQDMLKGCRENELPRPQFMICGVGTEIYVPVAPEVNGCGSVPWYDYPQPPQPEREWELKMNEEFGDRAALAAEVADRFPQLEIHGNVENDPYRLPCVANVGGDPSLLDALQAWAAEKGNLRVIVSGMGDYRYVDICSIHADKGLAVEHLFCKGAFQGIGDKSRILVAGDSGNDLRMFMVPGVRAVMVGNSQPSLVEAVLQDASIDVGEMQQIQSQLPFLVERSAPLLEVYYAKGIVGDGVCEAIQKYYFDAQ